MLFIPACKKQRTETAYNSNQPKDKESDKNVKEGHCRLEYFDWPGVGSWRFHYNSKGLADHWIINWGDGYPLHTNEMEYDQNNRLSKSLENYFGAVYDYTFYYTDNRLSRMTRINKENPADANDIQFTYNLKGENIKQDDDLNNSHVLLYYDATGNCTKTDVYFGADLWYSDIYTFNSPVKNPRKKVPGIEFGFPFYGTGGFTDKRWFTSNTTIIYDSDGTPYVLLDYDPAKTVFSTDKDNLPVSATYFDKITQDFLTITFGYEGCNDQLVKDEDFIIHPEGASRSVENFTTNRFRIQANQILNKRSKDMDREIESLRTQLRKK